MSPRALRLLFLVSALVLGHALVRAALRLPPHGHMQSPYGDTANVVSVQERQTTDAVTAVIFDLRGFDTLHEEFILFGAVAAVLLLLRPSKDERELPESREEEPGPPRSALLRFSARLFLPVCFVAGLNLICHGQLTPGGGFQGGVAIASAAIVVFLLVGLGPFARLVPATPAELAESLGVGGYVLLGLAALPFGMTFLTNVLPLGHAGSLLSGGNSFLLNLAVGGAVAGGLLLVAGAFARQLLRVRKREER